MDVQGWWLPVLALRVDTRITGQTLCLLCYWVVLRASVHTKKVLQGMVATQHGQALTVRMCWG